MSQLVREVKVQAFLEHPNLIRLYDFFADEENFYLLLELACDGPLFELLETQCFTEETTSMIVREIVAGVEYMHKHDVIHRDLKLENIVLSHVAILSFREWPKFVILDGQCTARANLGPLFAEHQSTSPLKFSAGSNTTRK